MLLKKVEDVGKVNLNKKDISYLILGSKGGSNRVKILKLLEERPFNINQMAKHLGLNYRTVQHHVDLLEKHSIVKKEEKNIGYGEIFKLDLIDDIDREVLDDIIHRFEEEKELTSATNTLGFFNRVIKQTNEAVIIVDRNWNVFFSNRSGEKIVGFTTGKLTGIDARNLMGERAWKLLRKKSEKKNSSGNLRIQLDHRSGKKVYVNLHMDPVKNDQEEIIGFVLLIRDDSRQKRIEKKLHQTIDQYRFLFNDAPSINFILDNEGNILESNEKAENVLGYGKKILKNSNMRELIPDEKEKKEFERILKTILRDDFYKNMMNFRIATADGSIKKISFISGKLIPDIEKESTKLYLTGIDHTDMKNMENGMEAIIKEGKRKQKNIEALGRSIPLGVVIIDAPDGQISFMNDNAKELYGKSDFFIPMENHSEKLGLYNPDGEMYDPEELPVSRALLKGEEVNDEEIMIKQPNGKKVHVLVNARPIRDEEGNVIQAVGIFWDISEIISVRSRLDLHQKELKRQNDILKRSQEELERSRNQYLDLFDQSPMGLFKLDNYGIITDLNEKASQMLKSPRKHLMNRPLVNMISEKYQNEFQEVMASVKDKKVQKRIWTRIIDRDRDVFEALLMLSYVDADHLEEPYYYLTMVDI